MTTSHGSTKLLVIFWALTIGCEDRAVDRPATVEPAAASAGAGSQVPPSASPSTGDAHPRNTILVSFKLDPRLAGGTYGGEVWVSPSRYVGITSQDVVEARATYFDAAGEPTNASPEWSPADPGMVEISPSVGGTVSIRVKRAGSSTLSVMANGVFRELFVEASALPGGPVQQVAISQ